MSGPSTWNDARRLRLLAAGGVAIAAAAAMGLTTTDGRRGPTWVVPLVLTVLLTAVVPARIQRGRTVAWLGVTCLVGTASVLVGSLPFGVRPSEAVRVAAVDAAVAVLLWAAHRAWPPGARFEEEPRVVTAVGAAALASGAVLVLTGGVPSVTHPASTAAATGLQFTVLALVVAVVVSNRTRLHLRIGPGVIVLFPFWVLCVVVPVMLPGASLTWLVVVSAFWAGIMLDMRGAAVAAVVQLALVEFVGRWAPPVPEAQTIALDLLVAFATVLTFVLVAYRGRAALLRAELRVRAEEEALDSAFLDDVMGSMDEGLVLTDGGRIVLTTPSARRLLGLTTTRLPLEDWLRAQGFLDESGEPLPPGTCAALLDPPEEDLAHIALRSSGLAGVGERHLDLAVRSVSVDGRRLALATVTDVTDRYVRERRGNDVAGAVAKRLAAPLESVRRRLDAASGAVSSGDLVAAGAAVAQAEASALRMRGLIDDYLAVTVVREGVLHVTAVSLEAVVEQAVREAGGGVVVESLDLPHRVQMDASLAARLAGILVAEIGQGAAPDAPARLRIHSEEAETGWVRVVAHGRAGAGDKDDESIFGLADGDDDADVGSDLARSIVERHGGAYSARAAGLAVSITFTLPLSAEVLHV